MDKDRASAPNRTDTEPAPTPRSARTDIAWPALPAPESALILALQHQFERSQWWPPETLLEHQLRQIELLLAHAARTVPFYRGRIGALAGLKRGDLTLEAFRRIPVMQRTDIQESGPALLSTRVPANHGATFDISTSGSTGRPITVKGSAVTSVFFFAVNLRYHIWHGRDFSGKLARISVVRDRGIDLAKPGNWVPGYSSGPMFRFDITRPVGEQLDWLAREDPDYLLTYPSNLAALLRRSEETGVRLPRLRGVSTMAEVLDPEVREACDRVWGVPLHDAYSAREIGIIALQCPKQPHYHVQSETVLVEVLDDDGNPCAPSAIGRVVVTALHNFATPLIRYELGDYAEVGPPCPCGRGLPVLKRIVGRARNMLTLPSGEQIWPRFGAARIAKIAPIRQIQCVQKSLDHIEVRW